MHLLALMLLFAVADYVTGRDFFARLRIPGRSIWYVGPALALALAPFGWRWSLLAVAWALWRSVLGWGLFGHGRIDVKTPADGGIMFARNAISSVPAVLVLHYAFANPWDGAGVGLGLFCLIATVGNAMFGKYERPGGPDLDVFVDLAHGAFFGLIVGGLALTWRPAVQLLA